MAGEGADDTQDGERWKLNLGDTHAARSRLARAATSFARAGHIPEPLRGLALKRDGWIAFRGTIALGACTGAEMHDRLSFDGDARHDFVKLGGQFTTSDILRAGCPPMMTLVAPESAQDGKSTT
jgi:hypothetical protein